MNRSSSIITLDYIAVTESELTTVGGRDGSYRPTNKLQQKKWVEKYPPMNTACSRPVVVGSYI